MAFNVDRDFNRSYSNQSFSDFGGGDGSQAPAGMGQPSSAQARKQQESYRERREAQGGKKSPPPAPQIIYQGQTVQPQRTQSIRAAPRYQPPAQPDYASIQAQQQADLQRRREQELRGQATDIIDQQLSASASAARLYGTRSRSPGAQEYSSLVDKEFGRLMTMDTGGSVPDIGETARLRKYKGLKRGRKLREPLSSEDLLG